MKARYVLLIVFFLGLFISYIPGWLRNNKTRKQAQEIAQRHIKHTSSHLEKGQYTIMLPDLDLWGKQFQVITNIGKYGKSVRVTSSGHDLTQETDDDISATSTHTDIDKIVGDTIEHGSRRIGKGLVEGVIDGIRKKRE